MYRLLLKLEGRQLKNGLKSIITSPKRLISHLFLIGFMVWIAVFNFMNMSDRSQESVENFKSYFAAGALVLLAYLVYTMLKKSSMNFKMSEIYMLFPAPINPKKIMLFNLLKRIPANLLISIYSLIFILSMILGSVETDFINICITFSGYTLLILIIEPLSLVLTLLAHKLKKEDLQIKTVQVIGVFFVGFLVYTLYDAYSLNGMSFETLLMGLNNQLIDFFPVIGWSRNLMNTALVGRDGMTLVYLGLMVTSYLLMVVLTYYLSGDYYEDVIQSSEERAKLVKAAKEGKANQFKLGLKKKHVHLKEDRVYGGALDWKRKLLIKKKDISIYFSFETLLVIAGVIALRLYNLEEFKEYGPYFVGGGLLYIKFLFTSNGDVDDEISKPYFFLIPDRGLRKLLNVFRTDLERVLINGFVLIVCHSLLFGHFSGTWLLIPFVMVLLVSLLLFSTILVNLFLPNGDAKRFLVLVKMLQMILLLLPSFIVTLLVGIWQESVFYVLMSNLLVNSLLVAVLLILSDKIIERMEFK